MAFVLFLVVKAYNAMKRPVPQEPPGPSEIDLLIEIRDSLRKQALRDPALGDDARRGGSMGANG